MKNTWEMNNNRDMVNTDEVDGYGTQRLYLTKRKDAIIFNHKGVINNESTACIPLEALDIILWEAGYTITKRKSIFSEGNDK